MKLFFARIIIVVSAESIRKLHSGYKIMAEVVVFAGCIMKNGSISMTNGNNSNNNCMNITNE